MKTTAWLIVNNKGSVSVRKGKPSIGRNEVSMKVDIDLPDALFRKPSLQASIKVDPDSVGTFEFNAETVSNVKELIQQGTGLDFDIQVVTHQEEQDGQ